MTPVAGRLFRQCFLTLGYPVGADSSFHRASMTRRASGPSIPRRQHPARDYWLNSCLGQSSATAAQTSTLRACVAFYMSQNKSPTPLFGSGSQMGTGKALADESGAGWADIAACKPDDAAIITKRKSIRLHGVSAERKHRMKKKTGDGSL